MKKSSQINILYEDEYLLAADKPGRLASVAGPEIPISNTLMGQLQRQYREKGIVPYPLHRLDQDTSGIMLFGKFPRDRALLEGIFGNSNTHKKYIALVQGIPRGNSITRALAPRQRTRPGSGKLNEKIAERIPAETLFKVVRTFNLGGPHLCLVEAEIKTGRKHQIRQHFAQIYCPVVMDNIYGDKDFDRKFRIRLRLGRLFLHAASLSFFHPYLKKQVIIESPVPPDLKSVLKKLS